MDFYCIFMVANCSQSKTHPQVFRTVSFVGWEIKVHSPTLFLCLSLYIFALLMVAVAYLWLRSSHHPSLSLFTTEPASVPN